MGIPEWMQAFIPNFGDGMAGPCNMYIGGVYSGSVSKIGSLISKMAVKTGSM